jgi:hypothetical protein
MIPRSRRSGMGLLQQRDIQPMTKPIDGSIHRRQAAVVDN